MGTQRTNVHKVTERAQETGERRAGPEEEHGEDEAREEGEETGFAVHI